MRRIWLMLGVLVLTWFSASAQAETPKWQAGVSLPWTEVRSGPGLGMPAVGRLNQGEQVWIYKEEGQWYAIAPPAGSKTWINHRYLGRVDPAQKDRFNAVIEADCPREWVRYGVEGKNQPLDINSVRLPRGTIVEVVGQKVSWQNSTWYPIVPPPEEYRWIPKQAVTTPRPATSPPPMLAKEPKASTTEVPPPVATVGGNEKFEIEHRLWPQAVKAHQNSDYKEAERLYRQILADLNQSNAPVNQILLCENRIDVCRNKQGLSVASYSVPNKPEATPVARTKPDRDSPVPDANRVVSSGPVRLRRSALLVDNRITYALENARGELLFYGYVDPGVDLNLENYVNRSVSIELLGIVRNRGDVRNAPFMTVSQVRAR